MVADPAAPTGRRRVRTFNAAWETRDDAQRALAAFQLGGAATRETPAATTGLTLGAAFDRYFQVKARKRTLAEDRRTAAHLLAEFGAPTLLSALTASRISEYQAQRLAITQSRRGGPLSPAAINRPLALLRALLRLAHTEWEVLPSVPKIRPEKEAQGRLRWLTPEEARRLLAACAQQKNPVLIDLVTVALYTGLRQGELLGLIWPRVDRARGVVLLEVTKNGRRREVPLNAVADAILARRSAAGTALVFGTSSWDAFRKHWEAAVEVAGIDDFRFHDLRHTFASWAMQRGATLPELKELLGHSSLEMVLRYAHLAPGHLRTAVARLDAVLTDTQIGPQMAHSVAPNAVELAKVRAEDRGINRLSGAGGGS